MEDYYDLDAILAQNQKQGIGDIRVYNGCFHNYCGPMQRIPCTLLVDLAGLQLDDSHGQGDVQAGTKLEIPFWLAETLAANDFVDLDLPKAFTARTRRILQASTTNVNFHTLCPYFYQFGMKLAETLQEPQLNQLLSDVYRERLQVILDAAQRADSQNMIEFVSQLEESEKQLYTLAKQSTQEIRQWQRGQTAKLQMADVLKSLRINA